MKKNIHRKSREEESYSEETLICNPAFYSAEFYSNQKQPQYTKVAVIYDDINVNASQYNILI